MNELRILIARLGCPSTSTRWWTMQELAARLGEPSTKIETESALFQFLRSRKLEAEVVEVLSIFWMAVQGHDYSPDAEIAKNIPKPSVLSDLLVKSCGLSSQTSLMDLKQVPEDFEIPDDFNGVEGTDLPRIFQTTMRKLEAQSGFPFVRQMAFEWMENSEAYPDAPYQGDPWHFSRSLGDGFIGQFSARAALRSISAYLRTLAVAKQLWAMPPELVEEYLLLALPIHPTFALLRPRLPDWFPSPTEFDGDSAAVEAAFRALLARVEKARPGDELIACNSPVVMSIEHCVEVSIVRWSQVAGSNIDDDDLAAHLKLFLKYEQVLASSAPEPLSATTLLASPTIEQLVNDESKAWPLAGTLDFARMGYLQHDLYPSRLYFPTVSGLHSVEITPCDGQLNVTTEDQVIADFCYWNAGWGSARPRQLRGNCGTALVSRGKAYREGAGSENESLRGFYLWQVRKLNRSSSYEAFNETLSTGVLFV